MNGGQQRRDPTGDRRQPPETPEEGRIRNGNGTLNARYRAPATAPSGNIPSRSCCIEILDVLPVADASSPDVVDLSITKNSSSSDNIGRLCSSVIFLLSAILLFLSLVFYSVTSSVTANFDPLSYRKRINPFGKFECP